MNIWKESLDAELWNILFEYLGKIVTEFVNTLACSSGAWMGSNHQKNKGMKSRDTLPFYYKTRKTADWVHFMDWSLQLPHACQVSGVEVNSLQSILTAWRAVKGEGGGCQTELQLRIA